MLKEFSKEKLLSAKPIGVFLILQDLNTLRIIHIHHNLTIYHNLTII